MSKNKSLIPEKPGMFGASDGSRIAKLKDD